MTKRIIVSIVVGLLWLAPSGDAYAATSIYTLGATGVMVREIQERLAQWAYYQGQIHGEFDEQTLEAVKFFQTRNRLSVDGLVGKQTLAALGLTARHQQAQARAQAQPLTPAPAAPTGGPGGPDPGEATALLDAARDAKLTAAATETELEMELEEEAVPAFAPVTLEMIFPSQDSDIYLLAKIINGEARGESYEGQVAVGAVVLNRMAHPGFPKTLTDVIHQPGAFTAVRDGQFGLEPSNSCVRAAQAALNGADPTDGAIYFWNPKTATSAWIKSVPITTTIGNHVFGYK